MGLGLPALLFPWVALVIGSCSAAWLSLPRVSSVGPHVAFLLMEGASVSWLRSAIHCEASLYFSRMLGVFLSSRWEPVHFLLVPEVGQRPSPQRAAPQGPLDGLSVAVPIRPSECRQGLRVGAQGPASPPSRSGLGCWSPHPAGRRADGQEWVPGARRRTDVEGVPVHTRAGHRVRFFKYSS